MLTYDLSTRGSQPLYLALAEHIRDDIAHSRLAAGVRLPSKRSLSETLGVSLVTVEAAYRTLIDSGVVTSSPRRGYFVSTDVAVHPVAPAPAPPAPPLLEGWSPFPYAAWARTAREVLAESSVADLERASEPAGAWQLRRALADHCRATRGWEVSPECIVIGAGAQVLTVALTQVFEPGARVGVENPGYPLAAKIFRTQGCGVEPLPVDDEGLNPAALAHADVDVAYVTPSHQFPTGARMSLARRYDVLAWAAHAPGRLLIEDDYASQFHLHAPPSPTLASLDHAGTVVYMNTFTLALGAGFRLGYMVVPARLLDRLRERVGFYSSTVSALEQLTLARFIDSGALERHVARLRAHYRDTGRAILAALTDASGAPLVSGDLAIAGRFVLEAPTPALAWPLAAAATYRGARARPVETLATGPHPSSGRGLVLVDYARLDRGGEDELAERIRAIFRSARP